MPRPDTACLLLAIIAGGTAVCPSLPAHAQLSSQPSADEDAPVRKKGTTPVLAGESKRVRPSGVNAPLNTRRGPRIGGYFMQRWNDRFDTVESTADEGIFAPLKHIDVTDNVYVTLSGEERIRSVLQNYGNFIGGGLKKGQGYVALRHQYGADIHVGSNIRAFAQVVSAQQPGFGIPQPYPGKQENNIDVAELFLEVSHPLGTANVGARIGRQQMTLGNGLLFALQPAANVEQAHDGIVAYANTPDADLTLFSIKPVNYFNGAFDDKTSETQKYAGAYGSVRILKRKKGGLALDPFIVRSIDTPGNINRTVGDDRRWTAGARLWGGLGLLSLDWTTAYQWGSFDEKDVKAAAIFTDTQFRIFNAPANARISLRADMATGGSRNAATVKTFRPFFHAQLYQTIMGYLTPANSVDGGLGLLADPDPRLTLQAYARRFWRYSTQDVIYGRGFVALNGTGNYDSKAMGDLIAASGRMQFNKHLSFTLNGGIFSPSAKAEGSGLRKTKTLTAEILYMF